MDKELFIVFLVLFVVALVFLHIDHNKLDSKLSDIVKELNKYRAVESQGRCYKLEIPKDFGVAEDDR